VGGGVHLYDLKKGYVSLSVKLLVMVIRERREEAAYSL